MVSLNDLPDEIVLDIMLRLPIKSLIRCTFVCKPWESMIKSSEFIYTHLNRTIKDNNEKGTHLLLHHGRNKTKTGDSRQQEHYSLHYDNHGFDFYRNLHFELIERMVRKVNLRFRVAGICNGLICLADDMEAKECSCMLWNPSVRKIVRLPRPTITNYRVFEDTIGFGFDALTNDYKVVRLVTPYTLLDSLKFLFEPTLAEVYSLTTSSWTSLGSIACRCDASPRTTSVVFNGAIHWAVQRWNEEFEYYSYILTFDLASEAFGEILMPESIRRVECVSRSTVSVTRDGNSLALFTTYKELREDNGYGDGFLFEIWVMKEYDVLESWTKMMRLECLQIPGQISWGLGFSKTTVQIFLLQWLYPGGHLDEGELNSFDLVNGKVNILESCWDKYCYSVDPYQESLVLLDVNHAILY